MSINNKELKKTIKPSVFDDIRDKTKPIRDSIATNMKSFGKINLKNGPALSKLKTLKIDGAMTAVWKSITPQISPDSKI